MAIQGLRATDDWSSDERPLNWRAGLLLQYPNGSAPLFAMTSLMKKRSVDDPEFNWWEKSMQTRRLQLSAAITVGDTTLPVSSGATGFKQNDVFLLESSGTEVFRVASDPSSDTALVVERGFAGSTAALYDPTAVGANPFIVCIGNAMEEGSLAPSGVNFDPTKVYNYTQIFRHTFEMTDTASQTRLRTTDQVKEAKRETMELHSTDIERALWDGQRSENTFNGKPQRTLGGIDSFIDSGNIVTAGASTDMEQIETWMELAFRFGSSEKVGFCGNYALTVLNQICRKNSTFNLTSGDKEYGMKVNRLICPHGEIVLKTHPLFNQQVGGLTGGTAYYGKNSWLYILDMEQFKYVYMKGRDTKYQKKLEDNSLDGIQSGYLTECSLEVHHPENHFLIKSLKTAAIDT